MPTYAYSWELTSYKINSNGSRICFDAYFIPFASFWELSFLPLRSIGSSSYVLVLDGLAPSIFLLSSCSYEVSNFGARTKGSY